MQERKNASKKTTLKNQTQKKQVQKKKTLKKQSEPQKSEALQNNIENIVSPNGKVISMWKYYIDCITQKYCTFKGRANRKEYWGFVLFDILVSLIALTLMAIISEIIKSENIFEVFRNIWWLIFLLPGISVRVRRLHDINLSGWWLGSFYILLLFLLIISAASAYQSYAQETASSDFTKTVIFIIGGGIVLIYSIFLYVYPFISGDKESNKYGEVPEGKDLKTSTVLLFLFVPIAAVFIAGVIAGYSSGTSKYKITKAIDQISYITDNTHSAFANQSNYGILRYKSDETMLNMHLLPEEMVNNTEYGHKFTNIFNGNVFMSASDKLDLYDNQAFTLTLDGLSSEICMNLVLVDWSKKSKGSFMGMHIFNSSTMSHIQSENLLDSLVTNSQSDFSEGLIAPETALNQEDARTLCSCGTADTCAITWKFQ